MTALLTARGVVVLRGGVEVLHGVDLEVHAGEVLAVLGPNGAGKSTLLSALGSQVPLRSGTVAVDGRVATALQSPDVAHRTVLANVELALAWWGVARPERRGRAERALALLRADHLSERLATELSGGERRRVHLARAFALEPDVLLLDEPFAGLDPEARAGLLEDAAAAVQGGAQAVVVVVHDRSEAWALATRLLVVLDGRVAADGRPEELLSRPPSPEVARFLGFTGELSGPEGLLLTRPSHVRLDGPLPGRVTRRTTQEDTVLLDVRIEQGTVQVTSPYPGPAVGDPVGLEVVGGVRFPQDDARTVRSGPDDPRIVQRHRG